MLVNLFALSICQIYHITSHHIMEHDDERTALRDRMASESETQLGEIGDSRLERERERDWRLWRLSGNAVPIVAHRPLPLLPLRST